MSYRLSYRCSDPECKLSFALHKNSPVWKEGTPSNKKFIPVSSDAEEFVEYYEDQELCVSCRSFVKIRKPEDPRTGADSFWKNLLHSIKRLKRKDPSPIIAEDEHFGICPECNTVSSFVEEGSRCAICGEGTVIVDDHLTVTF